MNGNNVTYFDSFEVEHLVKKNLKFIGNKNIIENNYRLQANDSIMCEQFFTGFIDFMLESKSLLEYTKYEKNDKIILKHIQ